MGKPYTMREYKKIVEYLVEHGYYGEIRGRKMWMDFESTHALDRTWQSLKETFLKRILPDIHNPYFKLSVEQIASFRKEADVTGKNKNKLEIVTVTDSSSGNAEQQRDNEQPCTSKAIPENERPGEDNIQCGKIKSRTRSSTDTLVLERGDQSDEDALDEADMGTSKSFRDLITYSEPLTPMLQEVLHDFDSDDDPPMQIVEEAEVVPKRPKSPSPFEIRQSRSMKNDTKKSPAKPEADNKDKEGNMTQPAKIKSLKLKKTCKGTWEKGSGNVSDNPSMKDGKDQNKKSALKTRSTKSVDLGISKELNGNGNTSATHQKNKTFINSSSTSTDTQIPNNQEALKSSKSSTLTSKNQDDSTVKTNGELKRSHTPERVTKNKRSKSNSVDTNSDIQIIKDSEPTIISIVDTASQHDSSKENLPEAENNQEKNKSNKNCTNDNTKATDLIEVSEESNTESSVILKEAGPSEDVSNTPAEINPCLNSVSLFAEQFSTEKYSGSESDEDAIKSKAKNVEENLKRHNITEEAKNKNKEKPNNSDKAEEIDNCNEKSTEKEILKKNERVKEVKNTSEATDSKRKNAPAENRASEKTADSVFRNSTDSDFAEPKPKNTDRRIYDTKTRDKALADVFGFSTGGARKRSISYRDKNKRIYNNHGKRRYSTAREASSSYASSSSDSDDSGSPRRHRHKIYVPKPYPILKKDGALFVTDGETLYPLVLRDQKGANFVELLESDDDQDVSYWQKKCAQEKIRADELARLLERQKLPSISPTLQRPATVLNSTPLPTTSKQQQMETDHHPCGKIHDEVKTDTNQDHAVKMKVSKNNIGVEFECHFAHVDPLLEKLSKMLHMETSEVDKNEVPQRVIEIESGRSTPAAEIVNKKEIEIFKEIEHRSRIEELKASRTPQDSNVTKRKRGRQPKQPLSSSASDASLTVTKRARARSVSITHKAKRSGTVTPKSPAKRRRALSVPKPPKSPRALSVSRITETKRTAAPKSPAKSPRAPSVGRNTDAKRTAAPKTPAKSARALSVSRITDAKRTAAPKTPAKSARALSVSRITDAKRPAAPKTPAKSARALSVSRITDAKRPAAPKTPAKSARAVSVGRITETKETTAPKSPAKSDIVPTRTRRMPKRLEQDMMVTKREKTVSKTNVHIPDDDSQVLYKFPKSRSSSRSRASSKREKRLPTRSRRDHKLWSSPETCNSIESSLGYQDSDDSLESTALRRRRKYPSSQFYRRHPARNEFRRKSYPYLADDDTYETVPNRSGCAQNGSLNTEVYRSESYQLLGVKNQIGFVSINITNINSDKTKPTGFKSTSNVETFDVHVDNVSATLRVDVNSSRTEDGNSSNVSFPLSPVLSVADNISVTKEVLETVDEHPTLNETRGNEATDPVPDSNKYMISEIDVSLPLMGQDCELHKEMQTLFDAMDPENDIISESLVGEICAVNLKEQSASDSLAVKLRNLLLESAKKIAQKIHGENDPNKENAMEVDTTVKKKPRANKKRCSTPHKKVSKNGSELKILKEHLESCSYSGRKSCPPAIKVIACEDICVFDDSDNNNVLGAVNTNRRGKKKKDVIKVKITRPSKEKKSLSKKEALQTSRKSVYTDSGINDESFLQCCNEDSIELIHNHSETCLQTHECLGDSIEFIQNQSKSIIISVDSDSMSCEHREGNSTGDRELLSELFCDNAQDVARLNERHGPEQRSNSTPYFTPLSHESPNSLITEDLSVEIASDIRPDRTGKWHLCSDDESTLPGDEPAIAGIGANLKQIFTHVCVPNLSTISETSRENDSRKPTLDADE